VRSELRRPSGRRTACRLAAGLLCTAAALWAGTAGAQQARVADTVHNLSVSGPGEVKSLTETEICKFCHVPHNAVVPQPLWGHALSDVARYEVPQLRRGGGRVEAPQPNGSSRLCLSCHDGTVALGDVAGESRPISMSGSQQLRPGMRGYIGTDLSGSHPVSFVLDPALGDAADGSVDMGLKPLALISSDPDVRLDAEGRMQCTTCHDPHADRYYEPGRVPRFWTKPTVTEVCLTCHAPR
jgi:hypothetical protein